MRRRDLSKTERQKEAGFFVAVLLLVVECLTTRLIVMVNSLSLPSVGRNRSSFRTIHV
jgi:hypothetical protein